MRILIKIGGALLLLAMLLIGLTYSFFRAHGTNGPVDPKARMVASETRNVGTGIETVELNGPIDMTLRQGAVASMIVRGEQRMLSKIETTQEGSVLHIGTTGMLLHHRQPLQVVLVLPSVANVKIHGTGDSTVNGFTGDKLQVQLHGSGNVKFNGRFRDVVAGVYGSGEMELNGGSSDKVVVELDGSGQMTVVGSCKEFKAEQNGSGDLDAEHLTADLAAVNLRGSGSSKSQAHKTAQVNLRGTGEVNIFGSPDNRSVSRTGTGEVHFRQ
jgi:hypothetical protein